MKFTLEFDTTVDRYQDLQKFVEAVNPENSPIEAKKVELDNLLEHPTLPKLKTKQKSGKVDWNFGRQEIDGVPVIIYFPENSDWQSLNSYFNSKKGYRVKDPKGVVHIFPNLSSFCKKQGIYEEYQTFNALASGRRKTPWEGWECVKEQYWHIQPYLHLEKSA